MAKPFKPGFFSNLNGIKDNNDRPPLALGGGAGTTNTFTNLGTGARVFAALVGADVRFRTLTNNDPRIVVDEAGDNVRVGMDFNWTQGTVAPVGTVPSPLRLTAQVLTGNNTAVTNRLIGARANSGLTAEMVNDTIALGTNAGVLATLIAPLLPPLLSLGETNTASNRGAGEGVFAAKVGVDLQFKSLVAGTNVTLSSDANTITINSTGGGGGGPTEDTTPPLQIGGVAGALTFSTTAFATKGAFISLDSPLTLKGVWCFVDPTNTGEQYRFNVSSWSGTAIGSTLTEVLGTTGTVNAPLTEGIGRAALFPTPVVLPAGVYLISTTVTTGTATTPLRVATPSATAGAIFLGTPIATYNSVNNTIQITSNNLTVGNTISALGNGTGYTVFPIV